MFEKERGKSGNEEEKAVKRRTTWQEAAFYRGRERRQRHRWRQYLVIVRPIMHQDVPRYLSTCRRRAFLLIFFCWSSRDRRRKERLNKEITRTSCQSEEENREEKNGVLRIWTRRLVLPSSTCPRCIYTRRWTSFNKTKRKKEEREKRGKELE